MDINKECSDALQIASEKEFISNEATYPNSPLHNTSSAPTQGEETIFLSKIKASIITVLVILHIGKIKQIRHRILLKVWIFFKP